MEGFITNTYVVTIVRGCQWGYYDTMRIQEDAWSVCADTDPCVDTYTMCLDT